MKFGPLITMMLFLGGCTVPQTSVPKSTVPQTSSPQESKAPNTLSRDAYDCERQAALAGVGSRAKAFDDCMRSRGRTPGR